MDLTGITPSFLGTANGEVAIWRAGNGPKAVVIHGGPGLSHSYLVDALAPLAAEMTLIFFDQLGCGATESKRKPITATQTISDAAEVIDRLTAESEYILVAHSWGALVAVRAIVEGELKSKPKTLILLNPVPLTRAAYDAAGAKLFERVPDAAKAEIGQLAGEGTKEAGRKLMQLALSAYSGRNVDLPTLNLEYNIQTYNAVAETLGDFDLSASSLDLPVVLVFGSTDYITEESVKDAPAFAGATVVKLPGGHFIASDAQREVVALIRSTALQALRRD
jgi:pimeloyl-ACP methyl ester carboxylesterase